MNNQTFINNHIGVQQHKSKYKDLYVVTVRSKLVVRLLKERFEISTKRGKVVKFDQGELDILKRLILQHYLDNNY